MLKNFRTYQKAKILFNQTQKLRVKSVMRNQLDRAALSVVLNLAEGVGKTTPKDRKRFYAIALGSLREVQAIMDLTNNMNIYDECDKLAAMIWCLIQNPGCLNA